VVAGRVRLLPRLHRRPQAPDAAAEGNSLQMKRRKKRGYIPQEFIDIISANIHTTLVCPHCRKTIENPLVNVEITPPATANFNQKIFERKGLTNSVNDRI
jgi:hypothetical protein